MIDPFTRLSLIVYHELMADYYECLAAYHRFRAWQWTLVMRVLSWANRREP